MNKVIQEKKEVQTGLGLKRLSNVVYTPTRPEKVSPVRIVWYREGLSRGGPGPPHETGNVGYGQS